jgi:hypothetical protein
MTTTSTRSVSGGDVLGVGILGVVTELAIGGPVLAPPVGPDAAFPFGAVLLA